MQTGNAYDPEVQREFTAELTDVVSVVHGDADLPRRRGHASGRYRRRHLPVAAGLVDRRRMGSAGRPPHTQAQPRRPALPRALHHARAETPNPMESWIAQPPRLRRRAWRPSAAGAVPSRSPTGSPPTRSRHPSEPSIQEDLDLDRRDAHARHDALARRLLRVLPRLSVLPGVPQARQGLRDLQAPRRQDRPLRRLPARAEGPSQGPGGHGHRVRPAERASASRTPGRSGATRAAIRKPTRPPRTPT